MTPCWDKNDNRGIIWASLVEVHKAIQHTEFQVTAIWFLTRRFLKSLSVLVYEKNLLRWSLKRPKVNKSCYRSTRLCLFHNSGFFGFRQQELTKKFLYTSTNNMRPQSRESNDSSGIIQWNNSGEGSLENGTPQISKVSELLFLSRFLNSMSITFCV